jgi:C2 domain
MAPLAPPAAATGPSPSPSGRRRKHKGMQRNASALSPAVAPRGTSGSASHEAGSPAGDPSVSDALFSSFGAGAGAGAGAGHSNKGEPYPLSLLLPVTLAFLFGHFSLHISWAVLFCVSLAVRQQYKSLREVRNARVRSLERRQQRARIVGEPESVRWLNEALIAFFPQVSRFASDRISDTVKDVLSDVLVTNKPPAVAELKLKQVDVGRTSPLLHNAKLFGTVTDGWQWEFGVAWRSEFCLKISLRIGAAKAVAVPLKVIVKDLELRGRMRVKVKFGGPAPPFVENVEAAFKSDPKVTFSIETLKGDLAALPVVHDWISAAITVALRDAMVLPDRIVVNLAKTPQATEEAAKRARAAARKRRIKIEADEAAHSTMGAAALPGKAALSAASRAGHGLATLVTGKSAGKGGSGSSGSGGGGGGGGGGVYNNTSSSSLGGAAGAGAGAGASSTRQSYSSGTGVAVGTLIVTLRRARGVISVDSNGLSDPFCRLAVGATQRKSSTKKKSLNPQWAQDFTFPVRAEDARTLSVRVFDWNQVQGDEFLGRASVDFAEDMLPEKLGLRREVVVPLTNDGGDIDIPRGTVEISLQYDDFDLSASGGLLQQRHAAGALVATSEDEAELEDERESHQAAAGAETTQANDAESDAGGKKSSRKSKKEKRASTGDGKKEKRSSRGEKKEKGEKKDKKEKKRSWGRSAGTHMLDKLNPHKDKS